MILQSNPGDAAGWVVTSAPRCLLALPVTAAAGADGLAERLAGRDGFRAVLELLVGVGIADAPAFALIDGDSSAARVVLRGEVIVTVTATDPDAAELTISGAGMATWSERVVEGARSLRLRVPGSTWTVILEPAAAVAAPAAVEMPAAAPAAAAPASRAVFVADAVSVSASVAEITLAPPTEIDAPPAAATTPPHQRDPAREPERGPEPYDFLFGDTIYRTQAGISVRIPNPDPEHPGDHDGRTMLAEELGLLDRPSAVPVLPELPTAPSALPTPLPPAPALRLERADGRREPLDRPVLIGRAPAASGSSAPAPRLITIADDRDVSRSHVLVAVEGDAIVVTDLASKNGTIVTLPGGSPRRLRGGEPAVVLPGTLIDLGGGVTFTVRED